VVTRRSLPRTIGAFLGASALVLAAAAQAGSCAPGNPMGRYEGQAKNSDGSTLAITLNLACAGGVYASRYFTAQGDFDGLDAAFAKGVLVLKFDAGWGPATARLTPKGDQLAGMVEVGAAHVPLAFTLVAPAWTPDDWRVRLDLTPAQWREDLAFLAQEVPRRHANAFATLPEAKWKAEVAALDARIAKLGPDQTLVAFTQLINAIGDGHTQIVGSPEAEPMPLELEQFDGAFRVVGVGPGLERALGTRVLAIDKTSIGKAHALALTLTPTAELPPLREGRANYFLTRGDLLHGLGVIQDREVAAYKLQGDAGPTFTLEVHGRAAGADLPMTRLGGDPRLAPPPGKAAPFWCKSLADDHAVYCDWTGYYDLGANAKAMWALIDQTKPDKLIIDMRDNGGGDNTVGAAVLVNPIKARPDLNQKGRLFVLIGPLTFSAAMNNAAQFQDSTNAILVGQTIGEKPNSYQEPRQFHLPNSHLTVRVSTQWYAFRKSGPNVVAPDKPITPAWADVKAGHDTALDWILAQSTAPVNPTASTGS
jgi:hypothetical protein